MAEIRRKHRYHSPWKRAGYSFLLVIAVLAAGTVGFHLLEHESYIDAFYITSMLATAQGPSPAPATPAGKLFACFMAFISVGAVVTSAGFLFGPFLGQLWRIGHLKHDQETQRRD